jgi:hypothetical protein
MQSLIHCIYASVATSQFNEEDLPQLLTHARAANARRGITGMLVYTNGNFLQIVEGEEKAVDELINTISKDPRHSQLYTFFREPIAFRSFDNWSMGFEALLPDDFGELIGENDFFDRGTCVSSLKPGLVKSVLTSFRKAQTG